MLSQFYLQIEGMRAGTKQHGDFVQRHAFRAQLFDALSDETRLFIFVVRSNQHRGLATVEPREQMLLVPVLNFGHHRVGHVEDRLCAAIVFFQLDNLRRGKELGKLQHVLMAGAAKGID